MMEWNDEYQKYALKVLSKSGLLPPMDHIGFAYLVFTECWASYDPLKSNPITYYGYQLKERIQRDRRYSSLVHIPVEHQGTIKHEYTDLNMPVGDGTATLIDILDCGNADDSEALLAHFSDSLASIYTYATNGRRLAVKAMQHHIFDGEPLPRKLRTELVWVRAEMYKKYKEWKSC